MTDADKVMNPPHFGSDPANTRIQINPEKSGFESGITFGWGNKSAHLYCFSWQI